MEAFAYVELPFWLMTQPGPVAIEWSGVTFTVDVTSPWKEVHAGEVTDSKRTVVHNGPATGTPWEPPDDLRQLWEEQGVSWLERPCKTVLRLRVQIHADALREIGDAEPPRISYEHAQTERRSAKLTSR